MYESAFNFFFYSMLEIFTYYHNAPELKSVLTGSPGIPGDPGDPGFPCKRRALQIQIKNKKQNIIFS